MSEETISVVVLVNVSRDWAKALGALASRVSGQQLKVKPQSWGNTLNPSHNAALLTGLTLDDLNFLRVQMRDGYVSQWLTLAEDVPATLAQVGLHIHPLA
jgi:alpha-D-ribose 1-methylphosphonate 5-triphosphate synthase subunit PhnH